MPAAGEILSLVAIIPMVITALLAVCMLISVYRDHCTDKRRTGRHDDEHAIEHELLAQLAPADKVWLRTHGADWVPATVDLRKKPKPTFGAPTRERPRELTIARYPSDDDANYAEYLKQRQEWARGN